MLFRSDNMVVDQEEMMQRELNFVIINEVDSILVDEARTPLIISGQGEESTELYQKADKFVTGLVSSDYAIDKKDIFDG